MTGALLALARGALAGQLDNRAAAEERAREQAAEQRQAAQDAENARQRARAEQMASDRLVLEAAGRGYLPAGTAGAALDAAKSAVGTGPDAGAGALDAAPRSVRITLDGQQYEYNPDADPTRRRDVAREQSALEQIAARGAIQKEISAGRNATSRANAAARASQRGASRPPATSPADRARYQRSVFVRAQLGATQRDIAERRRVLEKGLTSRSTAADSAIMNAARQALDPRNSRSLIARADSLQGVLDGIGSEMAAPGPSAAGAPEPPGSAAAPFTPEQFAQHQSIDAALADAIRRGADPVKAQQRAQQLHAQVQ